MCLTQSCSFRTTGLKNSRHFFIQSEVKPNPFAHIFPRFASATGGPGKRGHIVADTLLPTQMFPCLPEQTTFAADTKDVSDFVQEHFVSATNVSQFAQPKKHHGQQFVCNNVSSFTRALRYYVTGFHGNL